MHTLHTNTDEERTVVCGHLILNIVSNHGQRHHRSWESISPTLQRCGGQRNHAKFWGNLNLQQFKVIQGHRGWCTANRMRILCNFLLVINSNFGLSRRSTVSPINFLIKLMPQKVEGRGDWSNRFHWSTHVTDRWVGDSIQRALHICFAR